MKSLLPRRIRHEMQHPVTRFQSEMNRLIDSFFGPESPERDLHVEWAPSVDISETETDIMVKADLPGMDPGDLSVTISGNVLTISGEKKDERKETKGSYTTIERRHGKFQRSIILPSGLDADHAEAEFRNGVLSIKVPKTEQTRARKIPVKGEKQTAGTQ